jgi:xanthosine utilization system XapX-like protein
MTEKNPYRYGPTRGELWFLLCVSVGGMGLIGVALAVRGIPTGPALVEVVGIAGLLFGYLGARSVKRLIRNEHP